MRALLQIARTEILEHRRQPWMIFILAASYVLVILFFGFWFLSMNLMSSQPQLVDAWRERLAAYGMTPERFLEFLTTSFASLVFLDLPIFVGIMSGTSVLRDREAGTMPFLMLAPITRRQLIAGKLAGAMAIPLAFHFLFVGTSSVLFGQLPLLAPLSHNFAGSPAWWVAFLVGAPASSAFVGALATVLSALSSDIRTSMQATSFLLNLLGLVIGGVLVQGVSQGVGVQIAFFLGSTLATILTVHLGARLISKDVAAP